METGLKLLSNNEVSNEDKNRRDNFFTMDVGHKISISTESLQTYFKRYPKNGVLICTEM